MWPEEAIQGGERFLRKNVQGEQLRSLGLLILQKRRLRDDLITVHSFLEGSSTGGGGDLICLVTSDRTQGNGMKSGEVQIELEKGSSAEEC